MFPCFLANNLASELEDIVKMTRYRRTQLPILFRCLFDSIYVVTIQKSCPETLSLPQPDWLNQIGARHISHSLKALTQIQLL